MRSEKSVLLFLICALGCGSGMGTGEDGGAPPCEPSCRSGFVCLRGACVSACNPLCDPGERCTGEGQCVPGDLDAGRDLDSGGVDVDAGSADASSGDASTDAGRVSTCVEPEVLCGGSCRAPAMPEVGIRTPTAGRWSNDWFEEGDIAIDPCTGNIGLAWSQQVAGGANWEIYAAVVPAASGAAATSPIRITTAPGKADSVAVAWAGDRFAVLWSDPRHDPMPEACTRCLSELYFAAFDATSGALVVPEARLTTHASSYRAGSTRAQWGETDVGVTWTDSEGDREVHAAIVSPAGIMRDEQTVSAAPDPQRGNSPSIVWNQSAWHLLYRHDDPDGARPDYLHVRDLDESGALGIDRDLLVPAEQIALTARGASGYATITTGGSPLALRLWDLGWTATTTLASTTGTFDGSRGLAWDGDNLYATDGGSRFEVVRYNALGTETGRIVLTSDSNERSANEVRMFSIDTRLVVFWIWSTGGLSPIIHHRIQVVDAASAS